MVRMPINNASGTITFKKGFEMMIVWLEKSSAYMPQFSESSDHINRTLLGNVRWKLQICRLHERFLGEDPNLAVDLQRCIDTQDL